MGWELRGKRQYYYQKRVVDGHVCSIYRGGELAADLWAKLDAHKRTAKKMEAEAFLHSREAYAAQGRAVAQADEMIQAIVDACLVSHGYRRHRGVWRKKRKDNEA